MNEKKSLLMRMATFKQSLILKQQKGERPKFDLDNEKEDLTLGSGRLAGSDFS